MKIVHALGWYFPESVGGTEIYVQGLSRRLRVAGHDISVVAPDPSSRVEREYQHDGVTVYRYPIPPQPTRAECQGTSLVRGAEMLHAWIQDKRPDILHIHSFVTGLGIPEIRIAKQSGARIFATNHLGSLGFLCQRGTLMHWGEKLCDGITQPAKCAACVLHERGMPKQVARAVGAVPQRLSRLGKAIPGRLGTVLGMSDLISNNIAFQHELLLLVDKFVLLNQWGLEAVVANGAPREKLALNRLGLSQKNVVRKPGPDVCPTKLPIKIGYIGRFVAIKGVFDIARAMNSLPNDLPIKLEMRGVVNNRESAETKQELQAMLSGNPRVEFAPAVTASDVPAVMAGYDVLCCPSTWFENGPTVAIEAHAVGTPVIGTGIGGLAELIADGIDGKFVQAGDWRALASVFREMAEDPRGTIDKWRSALPAARTMDQIAADYLNLYETE